ncbi:hypothetical protein AYO38_11010 [bacterium SCGC AG-212-C10]|nr:hypothetical protein AYO38_11010 [bacterium SCGC AG-212-C10]
MGFVPRPPTGSTRRFETLAAEVRMKSVTTSLRDHAKATVREPAVSVVAAQRRFGVDFHRWTRWYTGAEPDEPMAICVHDNGTITRVRNNSGTMRHQSVASPASGSAWSTWTTGIGAARSGKGVSLCAIPGTSGECWVAYVDSAANRVNVRRSTDYGASWGSATNLTTEASLPNVCAIWLSNTNTGIVLYDVGSDIRRSRRAAGSFGASAATSISGWTSFTGIAMWQDGDNQVLLSGTRSADSSRVVVGTSYGEGVNHALNTWTVFDLIQGVDSASTISQYIARSIVVDSGGTRQCTFSEKETGNTAYTRNWRSTGARDVLPASSGFTAQQAPWSEPEPIESANVHGPALAYSGSQWYLAEASGVWNSPMPADDDLSARVVALSARIGHDRASATITLNNSDGALLGAPNGTFDALMVGGQVRIRCGYASGTAGAAEYGSAWTLLVDRITYELKAGSSTCTLKCSGPWERAARTEWKHSFTVAAAATLARKHLLFERFFNRAGIRCTVSATDAPPAQWNTAGQVHTPAFQVVPGERVAGALRRIVRDEVVGTVLDDTDVIVRDVASGEGADFTYDLAGSNFPFFRFAQVDEMPGANWARVQGPADRYEDAYSLASIYQHGPVMRLERDADASTATLVGEYASALLRRIAWSEDAAGELVAPWNAAIEPLDVVSIADARMGLGAATYRVTTLGCEFERGPKGTRYELVATLGAV